MRSWSRFALAVCLHIAILSAGEISSCAPNGIGITCNIFESDPDVFSLTTSVVPGYLVLLDGAGVDQTNVANWTDVLTFINDGNGFATTAQLLDEACNCFPSFATVTMGGVEFVVATPPETVYSPSGTDVYNIFSDASSGSQVPEPASLGLAAAALIVLCFIGRKGGCHESTSLRCGNRGRGA